MLASCKLKLGATLSHITDQMAEFFLQEREATASFLDQIFLLPIQKVVFMYFMTDTHTLHVFSQVVFYSSSSL